MGMYLYHGFDFHFWPMSSVWPFLAEFYMDSLLNDLKAKSLKNDLKGIWKTIKLASNINPNASSDSVGNEYSTPD